MNMSHKKQKKTGPRIYIYIKEEGCKHLFADDRVYCAAPPALTRPNLCVAIIKAAVAAVVCARGHHIDRFGLVSCRHILCHVCSKTHTTFKVRRVHCMPIYPERICRRVGAGGGSLLVESAARSNRLETIRLSYHVQKVVVVGLVEDSCYHALG